MVQSELSSKGKVIWQQFLVACPAVAANSPPFFFFFDSKISHMQLPQYNKNPHTRTPILGVQAHWVLKYRVFCEISLKVFLSVLNFFPVG